MNILLSANPSSIVGGNSATISATVSDDTGNPISGATVAFSLSPQLGSVSPVSCTTAASGQCTTIYISVSVTSITQVTITGSATKSGYVGNTGTTSVTVNPPDPNSLYVTVSATPNSINSEGTSTIVVHVTDGSNAVSGVTVQLSPFPTEGSLGATSGTTNTNGDFTTTYTAPAITTITNVSITATATKSDYTAGSGSTIITVYPSSVQPISVYSSASSTSVYPGKTSTITVVLKDSTGNTISGATVTGTLSPPTDSGTLSPFTESGGKYTATYTPPSSVTSTMQVIIYITASKSGYENGYSDITMTVEPTPTQDLNVNMTVDKTSVASDESVTITVTVTDQSTGSPLQGVTVTLSATPSGAIFGTATGTTKSNGQFTTTFKANVTTVTQFNITAVASKSGYNDAQAFKNVQVQPAVQPTYEIIIVHEKNTLTSEETITITITVKKDGQPVSGVSVNVKSDLGSLTGSGITRNTDANGQVIVSYTAPSVTQKTTVTITATLVQQNVSKTETITVDTTIPPIEIPGFGLFEILITTTILLTIVIYAYRRRKYN